MVHLCGNFAMELLIFLSITTLVWIGGATEASNSLTPDQQPGVQPQAKRLDVSPGHETHFLPVPVVDLTPTKTAENEGEPSDKPHVSVLPPRRKETDDARPISLEPKSAPSAARDGVITLSPSPSVSETPALAAEEDVFVPLREWKEKKLQDMESLIKKEALLASARSRHLERLRRLERVRFYALTPLYVFSRPVCKARSSQPTVPPQLSVFARSLPRVSKAKSMWQDMSRKSARVKARNVKGKIRPISIKNLDTDDQQSGQMMKLKDAHLNRSHQDGVSADIRHRLDLDVSHNEKTLKKSSRGSDNSTLIKGTFQKRETTQRERTDSQNTSKSCSKVKVSSKEALKKPKTSVPFSKRKQKQSAGAHSKKLFNYASVDAGARLLGWSTQAIGPKNLISENKDKYMLVPCDADGPSGSRWVDLELSEEIYIKSFQVGNWEFYSSNARKVAVLGASRYPPEKWNMLGIFNIEDSLGTQLFELERPSITKFLKFLFVGKQGSEYYCPISVVRVFGKPTIDDWREEFDKDKQEDSGAFENGRSATSSDVILGRQGINSETKDNYVDENQREDGGLDPIETNPGKDNVRVTRAVSEVADAASTKRENKGREDPESKVEEGSQADLIETTGNSEEMKESLSAGNRDGMANLSEEEKLVLKAVRDAATAPEAKDESIFRKITRMIRLIEVNQSLTNQYIDTHLARYAKKLNMARKEAFTARRSAEELQAQLHVLVRTSEASLERIEHATFKRDIMIFAAVALAAAFCGGYAGVMWTISRTQLKPYIRYLQSSPDSEADKQAHLTPLLPPSLETSVLSDSFNRNGHDSVFSVKEPKPGYFRKSSSSSSIKDMKPRASSGSGASNDESRPAFAVRNGSASRRRRRRSSSAKKKYTGLQNRFTALDSG